MKLYLLSEHLQKKLSFINHAVSSKTQLPVLSNILLEAHNGKLKISATDLEIGIQIEIPVNVEIEGGSTVPARIFTELINSLPHEKITIQTEGPTLEVVTSKTRSVFQTIPKEEFPKLYEEKGSTIAILKKEDILKNFGKVAFAASLDVGRPALSGILVQKNDTDNELLFVATDGYRLSLKKQNQKEDVGESVVSTEKPLLIPARVIREILGMKEEGDLTVFVSKESNQVLFVQGETLLIGRLLEAEYPNYRKIIPTDSETRVFFDKEELQKAVKTCSIFARETANIVRFSVEKDKIVVSANTPSVGQNRVEVEAKVTGEENEIAFNARYLLDLFANVEENDMIFEMTGPLNPGVFKIKGDTSFLHIIMPIRVQSDSA